MQFTTKTGRQFPFFRESPIDSFFSKRGLFQSSSAPARVVTTRRRVEIQNAETRLETSAKPVKAFTAHNTIYLSFSTILHFSTLHVKVPFFCDLLSLLYLDKKKQKTSSLLLSGPFAHKVAFDKVMNERASVFVRVCALRIRA